MKNLLERWKIWYADGSTFSSEDGSVEDAPWHGVVAIGRWAKSVGSGSIIANNLVGRSYYIYSKSEGRWTGHEDIGFAIKMAKHPYDCALKFGEEIYVGLYSEIKHKAQLDTESWARAEN